MLRDRPRFSNVTHNTASGEGGKKQGYLESTCWRGRGDRPGGLNWLTLNINVVSHSWCIREAKRAKQIRRTRVEDNWAVRTLGYRFGYLSQRWGARRPRMRKTPPQRVAAGICSGPLNRSVRRWSYHLVMRIGTERWCSSAEIRTPSWSNVLQKLCSCFGHDDFCFLKLPGTFGYESARRLLISVILRNIFSSLWKSLYGRWLFPRANGITVAIRTWPLGQYNLGLEKFWDECRLQRPHLLTHP